MDPQVPCGLSHNCIHRIYHMSIIFSVPKKISEPKIWANTKNPKNQYQLPSCLIGNPWKKKWQHTPVFLWGNSHGREAWWATVHRVTKSWTRLSDRAHTWLQRTRTQWPQYPQTIKFQWNWLKNTFQKYLYNFMYLKYSKISPDIRVWEFYLPLHPNERLFLLKWSR